jgi:hypothetical protein
MPKANVQLQPYPNQIEAFSKLVNASGLVPMRIVRPFAPYQKGDIAGFNHELAARLFVRNEGFPVNAKGEPINIDAPAPVEPKAIAPEKVEIPINWNDLHHLQRVQLAKQIVGKDDKISVEQADEIIVAELKRRMDDAQPDET